MSLIVPEVCRIIFNLGTHNSHITATKVCTGTKTLLGGGCPMAKLKAVFNGRKLYAIIKFIILAQNVNGKLYEKS